jgi:type I restriction enzyme S subunit
MQLKFLFQQQQLGDLTIPVSNRDPGQSGIKEFRYVDIACVCNKTFAIREAKTISSTEAPSRARKVLQADDVIIATTRPYLRSIAIVPKWLNGEICSTGFCVLRAGSKILPEWIYYWVLSDAFMKQVSPLMRGANYPAVTDSDIRGTKIPLPPLDEQRRIVGRIKECLSRVEEIERLRQESSTAAKSILRSFYHDTYSELLRDNQSFALGEAGAVFGGGTPSKARSEYWQGTIPWISPKEMKRRYISESALFITNEAIEKSSTRLITQPSVLFVVRGMILAHSFPVAVNRVPVTLNQDMKAISPRDGLNVDYLAAMLKGAERQVLSRIEVAGHGTRRLQTDHWISIQIPNLKQDEQEAVLDKVRHIEQLSDTLSELTNSQSINEIRESILRKAFAGEL